MGNRTGMSNTYWGSLDITAALGCVEETLVCVLRAIRYRHYNIKHVLPETECCWASDSMDALRIETPVWRTGKDAQKRPQKHHKYQTPKYVCMSMGASILQSNSL